MKQEKFLSIDGRIPSRDYFARGLAMKGLVIIFFGMAGSGSMGVAVICYPLTILCIIILQIQIIKRLHDINLSGWYSLVLYIPFINLIFSLYLMFKRGDKGRNQYGPNPFELEI